MYSLLCFCCLLFLLFTFIAAICACRQTLKMGGGIQMSFLRQKKQLEDTSHDSNPWHRVQTSCNGAPLSPVLTLHPVIDSSILPPNKKLLFPVGNMETEKGFLLFPQICSLRFFFCQQTVPARQGLAGAHSLGHPWVPSHPGHHVSFPGKHRRAE